MRSFYLRPRNIKFGVLAAALCFAACGFLGFNPQFERVSASASGPTPAMTNAPGEANCTSCHGDFALNSGTGNITISGLPVNYRVGQSYPVTVRVAQADAVIYGFELTSIDNAGRQRGTYTIPPGTPVQMQIVSGVVGVNTRSYIEHTSDGTLPTVFGSKTWIFNWVAPAQRRGKITLYSAGNAANSDGSPGGDYIYATSLPTYSGTAISTFDGDGKADISLFRSSNGFWYSLNSTNGNFTQTQFGASGDLIAPGDYDGDGKTDQAVFRPSIGTWFLNRSSLGFTSLQFGANGDIPASGDYDGDGKSDLAVWRPSNGTWYILHIGDGSFRSQQFGASGDYVAQGDYDADGKTDIAVYRKTAGAWYIWQSASNSFISTQFGISEDLPVPGDYDGDGRCDVAVWRPSNGVWYLNRSTDGFTSRQFGATGDALAPADYDGDGLFDTAIFRNGIFYILKSTDNQLQTVFFGSSGDRPVPLGYLHPF